MMFFRGEHEIEEERSEPNAQEVYDPHLHRVTYKPVSYVRFPQINLILI